MADKKQWKQLRQQLKDQGCECVLGGNSHYKVYRNRELISVMPNSPSDPRALRNQLAHLRRKGLKV